jgi:hypothetical protein
MTIEMPFALQRYVDAQVETGRFVDAGDVVRAVLRKDVARVGLVGPTGLSFEDGDLMALVQLVMMQCAKANADVLRDIMEELRRSNKCRRATSVDDVRVQLAEVDLAIKRLIQELDSKKREETDEQDRIEGEKKLFGDLQKAADAYGDILQSISSMFAR